MALRLFRHLMFALPVLVRCIPAQTTQTAKPLTEIVIVGTVHETSDKQKSWPTLQA